MELPGKGCLPHFKGSTRKRQSSELDKKKKFGQQPFLECDRNVFPKELQRQNITQTINILIASVLVTEHTTVPCAGPTNSKAKVFQWNTWDSQLCFWKTYCNIPCWQKAPYILLCSQAANSASCIHLASTECSDCRMCLYQSKGSFCPAQPQCTPLSPSSGLNENAVCSPSEEKDGFSYWKPPVEFCFLLPGLELFDIHLLYRGTRVGEYSGFAAILEGLSQSTGLHTVPQTLLTWSKHQYRPYQRLPGRRSRISGTHQWRDWDIFDECLLGL